jgi:predicted DNA-binding transcriptional regulator AlpA
MQRHINIPEALQNFDQLPDSANIRLPIVMRLYGISSASVWRGVKSGIIPKPRKLTPRTTAWLVADIRKALAAKVEG